MLGVDFIYFWWPPSQSLILGPAYDHFRATDAPILNLRHAQFLFLAWSPSNGQSSKGTAAYLQCSCHCAIATCKILSP